MVLAIVGTLIRPILSSFLLIGRRKRVNVSHKRFRYNVEFLTGSYSKSSERSLAEDEVTPFDVDEDESVAEFEEGKERLSSTFSDAISDFQSTCIPTLV